MGYRFLVASGASAAVRFSGIRRIASKPLEVPAARPAAAESLCGDQIKCRRSIGPIDLIYLTDLIYLIDLVGLIDFIDLIDSVG